MSQKPEGLVIGIAETGSGATAGVSARSRRSRLESQTEKRAQILRAASAVFGRSGYDGASMSDIAAEASVSKPTLYVYFDSKERLFDGLIEDMSASVPESVLELDAADPNIEAQLVRCGIGLMLKISQPERIDMLRVVAGAAGKFPEVGQKFFAAGPGRAIAKFKVYLAEIARRGWLEIADPELAAFQLLELLQSVHLRKLLFAVAPQPTPMDIERTVKAGVAVFLAAYRPS